MKSSRSMQEFDMWNLSLNERTGNIVGGHQRYKILLDRACRNGLCSRDRRNKGKGAESHEKIQGDGITKLKDISQELTPGISDIELTGLIWTR